MNLKIISISAFGISILLSTAAISQELLLPTRSQEEQKEIDDFGEMLVQIALSNHPDLSIAEKNTEIAQREENQARVGWLNTLSISGNLNETAINPPPPDVANNVYYPRYNFGLRVPLATFFNQPIERRIAKERFAISLEEKKKVVAEIRRTVLTAYNNYLLRLEIYEMKFQTVDEERSILQASENKFANGEISLEQYNDANRKYRLDVESLLFAQTNLNNSRLELEQVVGTSLEQVR
ncbi:MAG: TolC family protein [Bacteroidota bacterium]